MSGWLAIAALAGIATLFVWCAMILAASENDDAFVIRTNVIAAALWLAWAIITPIDWVIDRLRTNTLHHTPRNHGEGDGVGERVGQHGSSTNA